MSFDLEQSWRSQLAVTLGLIAAAGLLGVLFHFVLPTLVKWVGWPFA
jgi:hypothetical protein